MAWDAAIEELWCAYLHPGWESVYERFNDPDDWGMWASRLRPRDQAEAALNSYFTDAQAHPATLGDSDRDALLARLTELGARPEIAVDEAAVRRLLDHIVARYVP